MLFQRGEPLPEPGDPRLEVRLVYHPLGITVDQPPDAAAQFGDLRFQGSDVGPRTITVVRLIQPAPVLQGEPAGIADQVLDLPPDRGIQAVGADLRVGADPLTAKPVGIAEDVPVDVANQR